MDYSQLEHLSALKPDEQKRVIAACHAYEEVMHANYRILHVEQTNRQRIRFAVGYYPSLSRAKELVKEYRRQPHAMWWLRAQKMASMTSGGMSLKSGLLLRLITAGKPLKHPPPCRFGTPWYQLIERPGPHEATTVTTSELGTAGSVFRRAGRAKYACESMESLGIRHIVINKTAFLIVDANPAAVRLLQTMKEMNHTPDFDVIEKGGNLAPCVSASHPLWPEIVQIYREGPEFKIKHGFWPAWRLHLQTSAPIFCDPIRADEATRCGPFSKKLHSDPLDLANAYLDFQSSAMPPVDRTARLNCEEDAFLRSKRPAKSY